MAEHDVTQFYDAKGKGRSRYFGWREDTMGKVSVGDEVVFQAATYVVTRLGVAYRNKQQHDLIEIHLTPQETDR